MTAAFPGGILLTTDLSNLSWTALAPAAELARTCETRLVVATVLCPANPDRPESEERDRQEVVRALVSEAVRPYLETCPIDVVVATSEDPVGEIVSQAHRLDVGLVALAVRPARSETRKVLPSVTEELIRRGRFPVLAFPAPHVDEEPVPMILAGVERPKSEIWMG